MTRAYPGAVRSTYFSTFSAAILLVACGGDRNPPPSGSDAGPGGGSDAGEVVTQGIPVLGDGAHTVDAVDFRVVATATDFLDTPRDLAFNTDAPNELWVVNASDSVVIYFDPGTETQTASLRAAPGGEHFLRHPSALAFGMAGRLATAQETDERTQPGTPVDFMGPSLWPSSSADFDAGWASHLDMLHNSPNGVGIAWEAENRYWVVDGYHGSLTRYDFRNDHGPGGEDHTDGVIERYADGMIGYVENVPSHAELDHAASRLYVADAGNGRIAVLDTTTGSFGAAITPNYDGGDHYEMDGAVVTTFADGADGLVRPSGLALHENHVFVSDNMTSIVYAFDMEGTLVDSLDLSSEVQAGGLAGIAFGPDGALWMVDMVGERVLRVAAR
jgi:DNA-binding beta-propeller fold protein YncE